MHPMRISGVGRIATGLALVIVSALGSTAEVDDGEWRLSIIHYQPNPGDGISEDLGGLAVAHNGDAATIEPIRSMRFPCRFEVVAKDLRYLSSRITALRAELAPHAGAAGIFPPEGSELYRRIDETPSPYRHMFLELTSTDSDDEASFRFQVMHAGISYLSPSYPTLAQVASRVEEIGDSLAPDCAQPAFGAER